MKKPAVNSLYRRKIELHRETIVVLRDPDLSRVAGGDTLWSPCYPQSFVPGESCIPIIE